MDVDFRRSVVWLKDAGAELAEVRVAGGRLSATGAAIGADPVPYRLEYVLTTGTDYVSSELRVHATGTGWARSVELRRGGAGSWEISADGNGHLDAPPPGGDASPYNGSLDCDLGLSPLTNTLPVLRNGLLDGGDAVDLVMPWVSVPDLAVVPMAQRYTPLRRDGNTSVVRYESEGFRADIVFDRQGVVVDYPGLARLAGPG